MSAPFRRAHMVAPNEGMAYPRRFVFFDVESHRNRRGTGEGHRFRLAVAIFVNRIQKRKSDKPRETAMFLAPADLWTAVTAFARDPGRTVVVAHNLAYDLRIADAMRILPRLGWSVRQLAMRDDSCWLDLKRGKSTLLIVDSRAHLPGSVDSLAADLGIRRPALPDDGAGVEAFAARALADAHVIEAACLRLWDWQRDNEMGAWRVTGPAQATAAYRHRFMPERSILAHDQADVIDAERRAAFAGRCEVWRHGDIPGAVAEWDFLMAYAHIARDNPLPVRLLGSVSSGRMKMLDRPSRSRAYLADCTVTSSAPVVPAKIGGRILWPVGTFTTTLWDCEIKAARKAGADVRIERAWLYRKAPVLADWGAWIIDALEGPYPETDKIVRRALKQWSRWTVGRFALRYPIWDCRGRIGGDGFRVQQTIHAQQGTIGAQMIVAGELFEQAGEVEGTDSCPAITSWVTARARVMLWNAMLAAGLENVVYVDTDSIWTTPDGSANLKRAGLDKFGAPLRVKARHENCQFWGPRQFETVERRVIAGVPRLATRIQGGAFLAQIWEGVLRTLSSQDPDVVRVQERTIRPRYLDRRRLHLPDGLTAPIDAADAG